MRVGAGVIPLLLAVLLVFGSGCASSYTADWSPYTDLSQFLNEATIGHEVSLLSNGSRIEGVVDGVDPASEELAVRVAGTSLWGRTIAVSYGEIDSLSERRERIDLVQTSLAIVVFGALGAWLASLGSAIEAASR